MRNEKNQSQSKKKRKQKVPLRIDHEEADEIHEDQSQHESVENLPAKKLKRHLKNSTKIKSPQKLVHQIPKMSSNKEFNEPLSPVQQRSKKNLKTILKSHTLPNKQTQINNDSRIELDRPSSSQSQNHVQRKSQTTLFDSFIKPLPTKGNHVAMVTSTPLSSRVASIKSKKRKNKSLSLNFKSEKKNKKTEKT